MGQGTETHSIIIIPESSFSLLGRYLLHKVQTTIFFSRDETTLQLGSPAKALTLTCPISKQCLFLQSPTLTSQRVLKKLSIQDVPTRAEDNPPGLAKHKAPVIVVPFTSSYMPILPKQYLSSQKPKRNKNLHLILPQGRHTHSMPVNLEYSHLPVLKSGTQNIDWYKI